ncbi:MAG: electron transfer flavoprotein subunit alpha/FixB family protein [Chlorobium sp.]|nr:MAG: electron transfer flavoprotein subunit alpha/FixB family protein [Chlorobium sp.]
MYKYLVFLEQREGVVKNASIELWNTLQQLAAVREDITVCGVLAGTVDLHQLYDSLAGKGVVYHASDQGFTLYNSERYARLAGDIFKREACSALFFADTILSRELAPKLSIRLKAAMLSGFPLFDATGVDSGTLRPVYSGSAMASFHFDCPLRIYTISSVPILSGTSSRGHIDFIPLQRLFSDTEEEFYPLLRRMTMREGRQDVTEAGIIISGGRGVGGADGFVLLEQLALLLGGVVGASRPTVDEGWRPQSEQIGQTGKTVNPAFYFACGISGSVQHLAGIASSAVVVAINNDCHAPIFDIADYGIVGDLRLVLPELLCTLQDFLKKQ